MLLKVLGSSSKGNGYLLDNGQEALLIECGMPMADILKAVDFDTQRIKGAILTHEHGDHARHVNAILQRHINLYTSNGTAKALQLENSYLIHTVAPKSKYRIGGFTIMPFDVQHDAAEPLGYLIQHNECGNVLFATDTYYLKYKFKNLNNIIIECNYQTEILQNNYNQGKIPKPQKDRTMQSHMSLETCINVLRANNLATVNNIVLIHLSPGNSNASEFLKGIKELTGKSVHIADKGMIIEFNKTPF